MTVPLTADPVASARLVDRNVIAPGRNASRFHDDSKRFS